MAENNKDFHMTKEEVDNFEKAMKNEEFRKLLVEYAQEISDPENKKKYEEEISQMERERGMDVKFVNPEGGFVVKTTRVKDELKAFVNICYNEHIEKATSHIAEKNEGGKRKKGQQWSIPYSLSQPRDDLDRAGKKCVTIDAVFNPDTYKKCQESTQFKNMVIETALEGIERQLNIKLERKNLKFPKMKFKGMKQATVIRSKSKEHDNNSKNPNEGIMIGDKTLRYPYADEPAPTKHHKVNESTTTNKNSKTTKKNSKMDNTGPVEPEYSILHRGIIDFQNFTNARDSYTNTRPKELVVKINLPGLKSAASVELDIFEKQLLLENKAPPYHLNLALPYPIDEKQGSAKFDKSKHQLVVTLVVLPPPPPPKIEIPLQQTEATLVEEIEGHTVDHEFQDAVETLSSPTTEQYSNSTEEDCKEEKTEHALIHTTSQENHEADSHSKPEPDATNIESSETSTGTPDLTAPTIDASVVTQDDTHTTGLSSDVTDDGRASDDVIDEVTNIASSETSTGTTPDLTAPSVNVNVITQDDTHSTGLSSDVIDEGLAPDDVIDDVTCDDNLEDEEQDLQFNLPADLSEFSSPFFFKCPPYSYHQDSDTITFVIHAEGVSLNHVSLGFTDNMCYINFPSFVPSPHSLPGPDYALYVMFAEGQNLDPDLCHIDVSEQNLVLTLHKDDACKGVWDAFRAGPSEELLQEKYFVTESSIETMMKEIAEQDPWAKESTYSTDLEVTALSEESLTLKLESKLIEDDLKTSQACDEKHVDSKIQQNGAVESTDPRMEIGTRRDVDELAAKLQDSRLPGSDEGIEPDFLTNGHVHSSGVSQNPADVNQREGKGYEGETTNVLPAETNIYRSDSVDSASSDRSDSDSIANAIRMRKSCLRRTSSTSTDDSIGEDFDFCGSLSPNGGPDSPGKKNVRFNLNPKVRVFSNKKDKKRWKMEQKLKAQKMGRGFGTENGATNGAPPTNGYAEEGVVTAIEEEATKSEMHVVGKSQTNGDTRKGSESSVDEDWTVVDKPTESTLSNNLIFELDD